MKTKIKFKVILKIFAIIVILSIPLSYLYNEYFVSNRISIGFKGVYEKKIKKRTYFYIFKVSKDSLIQFADYRLSKEFEEYAVVGDTIEKFKNVNLCYIKKKNGVIKIMKFQRED